MDENRLKRLVIDLKEMDHTEIKRRAVEQRISIRLWVLEAIQDKINKEKSLGHE